MAFVALDNGMQAVMEYLQAGQILNNVWHFIRFGGFTDADVQSVGANLVEWFDTQMQANLTAQSQLTQIKVRRMDEEFAPTFEITDGLPLVGGAGGGLPNNATLAMSLRTVSSGRSFRGRTYQVGLPATHASGLDDTIESSFTDTLIAAYEALRDFSFDVADTTWAVFSRAVPVGTAITAITTDGVIDSQRRRLPGRGT